jgi:hypothetical protein
MYVVIRKFNRMNSVKEAARRIQVRPRTLMNEFGLTFRRTRRGRESAYPCGFGQRPVSCLRWSMLALQAGGGLRSKAWTAPSSLTALTEREAMSGDVLTRTIAARVGLSALRETR